jgi:hypothetical protein
VVSQQQNENGQLGKSNIQAVAAVKENISKCSWKDHITEK